MITQHVENRIKNRLQGLVDNNDFIHVQSVAQSLNPRKHYIRIKQFNTPVFLDDSKGDCITFIIENNRIITAMLSFNKQRWNDGTFKVLLTPQV